MTVSVLLIDDEKSFRLIFEAALRAEGYEVRSAGSVAEGHQQWRIAPADLVVIDRNLPDGDGVDVLAALKQDCVERNVDATFIVVTAYADVDNAVMALKRGADDYVTKPIQLPDLLVKLTNALERRRLERRVRALRHAQVDVVSILQRSKSPAMRRVLEMADKLAESADTPVLIQGESGSGKDMLARYIHAKTLDRSDGALVHLSCTAMSEELAESELFGHERGALPDAKSAKRGVLELAHEGTLFLDEIGDLNLPIQAKLLRVLETLRFRRLGGTHDIPVDVRVISATNRDLGHAVAEGLFRSDLYHRLDVFHIAVPPLRERREDTLELARSFLIEAARRLGKSLSQIAPAAAHVLEDYPFPGNVRELKNVIERAVILETGTTLSSESLVLAGPPRELRPGGFFVVKLDESGRPPPLREVERAYVERVVMHAHGNKSHAARLLQVSFPTIAKKLSDPSPGSES